MPKNFDMTLKKDQTQPFGEMLKQVRHDRKNCFENP